MKVPTLSIIIPVYNGGKFIQSCLAALMPQLNAHTQVIVINDGSTDATTEIIQQHFSSYIQSEQLVIYAQNNQGVSAARNAGLAKAKGDFIGFIDADDVVADGYIQEMMSVITQYPEIDIVEFGYKTFHASTNEMRFKSAAYSNDQFGLREIKNVIDKVYFTGLWYPWTRVFKASLFNDVRFPVGISFCEDKMTIPLLYEKSQRIFVLKKSLYGYRIHQESATFKVSYQDIEKLNQFYESIPASKLTRHTYLRISVAYAIRSCQIKINKDYQLPEKIKQDIFHLHFTYFTYYAFPLRKLIILFYPNVYRLIKKCIPE